MSGYEDLMGKTTDVKDHPSNTVPTATQHFAGATLPLVPSAPSIVPTQSAASDTAKAWWNTKGLGKRLNK